MTALEAYILARAYAKALVEGAGALKGAPCQIQSITPITGGNRITFAWENSEGGTETDTLDVMNGVDGTNGTDGADGTDGVGISSITFKEKDASGNNVYTVTLTNTNTYDITCPIGPQGETGATGATGNGIASITKTGTSGLVDTYTITYTNGTTSTFTVTNGQNGENEFIGTLDEWNALTAEQKKAYDTYQLTDDYTEGNYIYLPTIYSEEEREVGVWEDGKPLYQKVWTVTLPSTHDLEGSGFLIDSDVSYIDEIAMSGGYIQAPTGVISALNGGIPSIAGWNYGIHINSSSNLGIYTGSSSTLIGGGTAVVILQYTKTTDTAGSGTWTPAGQYAHHYSTDEQIIGTWIDGKTLYEKVFVLSSPITVGNDWVSTGITISNVSKIIRADGLRADGECYIPLDATIMSGGAISVSKGSTGWTNTTHIILQYTKAS